MIRKFSLAKGMFSIKISLPLGIRSKTGATHPPQKFFGYIFDENPIKLAFWG